MLSISQFFNRIRGRHATELFVRSAIQEAIRKHTSIPVPVEAISFASTSVVLKNINQTAKSVIFIKKVAIIREINTSQTVRTITDIK